MSKMGESLQSETCVRRRSAGVWTLVGGSWVKKCVKAGRPKRPSIRQALDIGTNEASFIPKHRWL